MPEEIKEATPTVLNILDLLKIPVLSIHGVEADDVIGTLSKRAADEGSYAIVVSPDRVNSHLLYNAHFGLLPYDSLCEVGYVNYVNVIAQ